MKLESRLEIIDSKHKAFAALNLNPTFLWAKFVLTDDQPNGNGERIDKSAFPRLISSGVLTPLKMALGEPSDHSDAYPIGTIAKLKEESDDNSSRVVGLAALWSNERPDDVAEIQRRAKNGEGLHVSWELLVDSEKKEVDDAGVTTWLEPIMSGAAIVALPSYLGRTPVEDVFVAASKKNDNLEDSEVDVEKIVEELKSGYETQKAALEARVAELEEAAKELEGRLLTPEIEKELEELRAFKAEVDSALEVEEKRAALRSAFTEAELEVDDEYFSANEERLLKLDEEGLGLFIETLKATHKGQKTEAGLRVPRLGGGRAEDEYSPSEIAQALQKSKKK